MIKTKHKINKKIIFYILLIMPALVQFAIMYIFVNFNSLLMAFQEYNIDNNIWNFIGLQNFKDVLRDFAYLPELHYGLINSIVAWLVNMLITIPFGVIFAYYIYKKFPMAGAFRVLLFLPQILSANILMIIFKYYADTFLPTVINKIFNTELFGFLSDKNSQFQTILIFNIFISFGTSVLMYTGAMSGISESVIEASHVDGVNTMQEFIFIVLPQIVGTVAIFIVTGIAAIFTNQLNLYSLYSNQADAKISTVGYYLYKNIQTASSYAAYPYNAALGVLITIIVAPIIMLGRYITKKIDPLEN